MRLAFVSTANSGDTDQVLEQIATTLVAEGLRVAGVVQTNFERPGQCHCDMDVRVLPAGPVIRISQDLGTGASGCRLDPGALEAAVAGVEAAFLAPVDLMILNRFGKQEAEGRGFANLIGEALSRDIPVLLGVNTSNRPAFDIFSEGMARPLATDAGEILAWWRGAQP